ncbi:hypothetical protein [Cognatiyoonia sp.]|uniref:hypothetical protein n=1 Tax=Cognatiyoonia sp. TaxID=2211652 RepID=UPI003F6A498C
MSKLPKSSVFLERKSYRQRRFRDIVRILPILGAVLWAIPLMWSQEPEVGVRNASALQYIFGMWLVLILISAVMSRLLSDDSDQTTQDS